MKQLTRRALGKLTLGAASAGLCSTAPLASAAVGALPSNVTGADRFPNDFLWGTATASYQVEGGIHEGGRGSSIWDTFSHTPGRVAHNGNGDIADDEFHRYVQDVALLKDLGVKTYRFSVAWSRIFPTGSGTPNEQGIAYYSKLVDALLAAGIEPYCTTYHWDLPQTLQDKGGWQNRDTALRYADYAGYLSRRLSDRVRHFMTLNEIRTFVEQGYKSGTHAPGLKLNRREFSQVAHYAVLAHGLGVQAIRASTRPGTRIGFAENPTAATPAVESAANIDAALRAFREENTAYLTVIMEGRYTERYLKGLGADAPKFTAEEMKIIHSPVDFVGLNIYQPTYIMAADNEAGYKVIEPSASYPRMLSPWLTIGPECLYWAPMLTHRAWNPEAIYITENGASALDEVAPDGRVYDTDRVMYLRNYISQLQKAVAQGAPVKGYFLWSLLDNFEWADGYEKRFGLFHVDFATQKRTSKLSAEFYRNLIASNRVV